MLRRVLLVATLLCIAVAAHAQEPRPAFVATIDVNTGDQPCGYSGGPQGTVRTFSKRWTSPYTAPVYLHRVESYRSIGGNLTPQAEGFSFAIIEQTGERIAMMPGQMKWPETTLVFPHTFEGLGAPAINPGGSVLVVGSCAAYGPTAASTVMKWVVSIWLYSAP